MIVCGYGAVGEKVVDILMQHDIKVIVVEMDRRRLTCCAIGA